MSTHITTNGLGSRTHRTRISPIGRVLAALACVVGAAAAHGADYKFLYTYPNTDTNDSGILASSVLSQGRDGNLYSTIQTNGTYTFGTIYKITTGGAYSVVYDFCAEGGSCTSTGAYPDGGVSLGFDGNLWGTTQNGGKDGAGTVFKLTPEGALTRMYSFTNEKDDSAPPFTVLQGQDGSFYGVSAAEYEFQYGAFFKLSTGGAIAAHPFDFTNGALPNLPVQGTDGNFYGTTYLGGDATCRCGVIYKATPGGAITVLHKFTGFDGDSYDGGFPVGILAEGTDGNFYGTTYEGGNNGTDNGGVVFRITPAGVYTIIHSFEAAATHDGQHPRSGLILATDGNFYGTTTNGGKAGYGTVYKTTPAGKVTVVYSFCTVSCYDGFAPTTALVQHTNGSFYGNTSGNSNGGSVFYSLNAGLPAFAKLVTWTADVGATVQILGAGFTATTAVYFDGKPAAKVDVVSPTYLTATVPAGALSGSVTVKTANATLKSDREFLVKPQVTGFTPTSGAVPSSGRFTVD
jgi:uncharacterized repeat protein (TIGR03803 family)